MLAATQKKRQQNLHPGPESRNQRLLEADTVQVRQKPHCLGTALSQAFSVCPQAPPPCIINYVCPPGTQAVLNTHYWRNE